MRDTIPREFYVASITGPVATTVGELQKQLARLPGDLPIDTHEGGVSLHVYNIDTDAQLGLEEGLDE